MKNVSSLPTPKIVAVPIYERETESSRENREIITAELGFLQGPNYAELDKKFSRDSKMAECASAIPFQQIGVNFSTHREIHEEARFFPIF